MAIDSASSGTSNSPVPTFAMSPHDRSLVSLVNSLFEPNFLILVSYLLINLWLAYKVIRLATKRYGELRLTPPESGDFGLITFPPEADGDEILDVHNWLFHSNKRPKRKTRAKTPVADTLIRLATWAFREDARNAKRIVASLAVISLASTWYYMISFLQHSYEAYLERCHLTGFPLPPDPPPFDLANPELLVPALHLRIVRVSQWLASLSLFKEAWMEVIKDAPSWWWSSEICIITVGAWALFLRHESKRLRIPHVWTVMALGQLVAISFAFNLFNLAVVYRLDTSDLLALRSDKVTKPKRQVIESIEEYGQSSEEQSPGMAFDESRPFRVAAASPLDADPSRSVSPDASLPPTPRRSPDPNRRVAFTDIICQKKPLPPRPTFMDKVGFAMRRVMPERFGMPLFVLAGLSSVLQHPNSFTKVMIMHLFPLLISLYPSHDLTDQHSASRRTSVRSGTEPLEYPDQTPELTTTQILRQMLSRSDAHIRLWRDPKVLYLCLGAISMVLRLWLTIGCFSQVEADSILHRVWQTLTSLLPTTFLQHPAQSSIGSDHVCVALSVVVFVLIESGVWLFKAAAASPGAHLPKEEDADEEDPEIHVSPRGRTMIYLFPADIKVIETEARSVVALLLLSPLLGGSATFSLYLAIRCSWIQKYNQTKALHDAQLLTAPDRPDSSIVEEREEVQVIENEEGERYLEVKKIKVKELRRRNQARPANPPPRTPSPPSQPSGQTRAGGRGRRSQSANMSDGDAAEGLGRRATPMRNRHPPQRYGQDSPVPMVDLGRR